MMRRVRQWEKDGEKDGMVNSIKKKGIGGNNEIKRFNLKMSKHHHYPKL